MDSKTHWETVYARKQTTELSWFQLKPARSLELLDRCGLSTGSAVIDIGGGDSTLVDALLERGVRSVTVLDLSGAALARARARLAERATAVTWLEADITRAQLPEGAWRSGAALHLRRAAPPCRSMPGRLSAYLWRSLRPPL